MAPATGLVCAPAPPLAPRLYNESLEIRALKRPRCICRSASNPGFEKTTVYLPIGKFSNEYVPVPVVTVARSRPVSVSVAPTAAPGITRPLTSRTVPFKELRSTWAKQPQERERIMPAAATTQRKACNFVNVVRRLTVSITPFEILCQYITEHGGRRPARVPVSYYSQVAQCRPGADVSASGRGDRQNRRLQRPRGALVPNRAAAAHKWPRRSRRSPARLSRDE